MYTKEGKKAIHLPIGESPKNDDLILIEKVDLAVLFSGSDVLCIPVNRSNRRPYKITSYRMNEAVVTDRWKIQDRVMYYNYQEIVIAVDKEQMLWRTAPDYSQKEFDKTVLKEISERHAKEKKKLSR